MAISCRNCGKELPDNAKFCSGCGSQVAAQLAKRDQRYCDKCEAELPQDAQFCLECGTPVVANIEEEKPLDDRCDATMEDELLNSSPHWGKWAPVLDFEKIRNT